MSKSKLYYNRRSVGQSVSVSGTQLGPATNACHSFFNYSYTVSDLFMSAALSEEKLGLKFSVYAGHLQRNLSQV
jgi:hypothetical protein